MGSSTRGFSVVEMLVVVAVLGFALMIGLSALSDLFKRQALRNASNDLKAFAQRVQIEKDRQNTATFLRVRSWTAAGTPVELILDTNANGLPDDGAFATYTLPAELALSDTSATGQAFDPQWVAGTDSTSSYLYLQCDFLGRAIGGTTNVQISAPATVPMTHRDMISGSLKPKVVFTLRINPVWSASIAQTVQ